MKRYLLLIITVIFSLQLNAQADTLELKKNIKKGMDSIAITFKNTDWLSFSNHMHPSLIKMLGGKEKFATFIEQQMKTLSMATVNRMETGNVLQLLRFNNQWQCVVEGYMQMTADSIIVSSVSSNIGVSYDDGNTWKFIRISKGNEEKIKKIFTDISPALNIPLYKAVAGVELDELLKTYSPSYPLQAKNDQ